MPADTLSRAENVLNEVSDFKRFEPYMRSATNTMAPHANGYSPQRIPQRQSIKS